ncbi:Arm DNA-binding domain-containing protein [Pectobacterium polaris]|uniref:Arm DNA-binding domain-containing protein n=1 Tax=Pectobacterium polaris TaxID=2042057 RepID=UPI0032E42161
MALSDVKVRAAKPEAKAYKLRAAKAWYYWFILTVRNIGGFVIAGDNEKMLALGKYPEISLADARARRDEARKRLANGVDPSENKKVVKVEQE